MYIRTHKLITYKIRKENCNTKEIIANSEMKTMLDPETRCFKSVRECIAKTISVGFISEMAANHMPRTRLGSNELIPTIFIQTLAE